VREDEASNLRVFSSASIPQPLGRMPQLLADGDKAARLLEAELETRFRPDDLLPHEPDLGFVRLRLRASGGIVPPSVVRERLASIRAANETANGAFGRCVAVVHLPSAPKHVRMIVLTAISLPPSVTLRVF
jgi:hypothetical protein